MPSGWYPVWFCWFIFFNWNLFLNVTVVCYWNPVLYLLDVATMLIIFSMKPGEDLHLLYIWSSMFLRSILLQNLQEASLFGDEFIYFSLRQMKHHRAVYSCPIVISCVYEFIEAFSIDFSFILHLPCKVFSLSLFRNYYFELFVYFSRIQVTAWCSVIQIWCIQPIPLFCKFYCHTYFRSCGLLDVNLANSFCFWFKFF